MNIFKIKPIARARWSEGAFLVNIVYTHLLSVHFISEPHTQSTDNSISPIRNRKRSEDIRVSPGNNHNEYFNCPECDHTFRSNQGLALHRTIHTLTELDGADDQLSVHIISESTNITRNNPPILDRGELFPASNEFNKVCSVRAHQDSVGGNSAAVVAVCC